MEYDGHFSEKGCHSLCVAPSSKANFDEDCRSHQQPRLWTSTVAVRADKGCQGPLISFSSMMDDMAKEILACGALEVVVALMTDAWVLMGNHGTWVQSTGIHGDIVYLSFRMPACLQMWSFQCVMWGTWNTLRVGVWGIVNYLWVLSLVHERGCGRGVVEILVL